MACIGTSPESMFMCMLLQHLLVMLPIKVEKMPARNRLEVNSCSA